MDLIKHAKDMAEDRRVQEIPGVANTLRDLSARLERVEGERDALVKACEEVESHIVFEMMQQKASPEMDEFQDAITKWRAALAADGGK